MRSAYPGYRGGWGRSDASIRLSARNIDFARSPFSQKFGSTTDRTNITVRTPGSGTQTIFCSYLRYRGTRAILAPTVEIPSVRIFLPNAKATVGTIKSFMYNWATSTNVNPRL